MLTYPLPHWQVIFNALLPFLFAKTLNKFVNKVARIYKIVK